MAASLAAADADARWPSFAPAARAAGFSSVQALPMRLRTDTIGAMNLLFTGNHTMSSDDLAIAQALADVATIGVLQQRALHRSDLLAEQLQLALNNRLIIEQAKGALAERGKLDIDEAFTVLRDYCRDHRLLISDTARQLVNGELAYDIILSHPRHIR